MNQFSKALQIVGALSMFVTAIALGYLGYALASNVDRENAATRRSVEFVLNLGGLKAEQEYQVINSFESARSFTGDHLDCYCIQISDFSPSDSEREYWLVISSLDGPVKEAAIDALSSSNASACFGRDVAGGGSLSVYLRSATLRTMRVTAYDMVFFDPNSKRLLYVSTKT